MISTISRPPGKPYPSRRSTDIANLNIGRIAFRVLVWILFIWAALSFVHDYSALLSDNLPVEGTLAVQVALISAAVFLVLKLATGISLTPRRAVLIILWVAMIVIGHHIAFIVEMSSDQVLELLNLDKSLSSLLLVSLIYLVALTIPFMPGLEIGVLIMVLFGLPGVVASYLATVAGLGLAYAIGKLVARSKLGVRLMADLGRHDVWGERLRRLQASRTRRWRYVLLAGLVNMPGNSVVGGGGGISVICGFSGVFHFTPFILTLMIATSPVSILVGTGILSAESLFFGL